MARMTKSTKPRNAIYAAYKAAAPLLRAELILELKKAGVYQYFWDTATKVGYDLPKAKAPLRDIFLKLMPETAPHFGLPYKAGKKTKPGVPGSIPLFEQ